MSFILINSAAVPQASTMPKPPTKYWIEYYFNFVIRCKHWMLFFRIVVLRQCHPDEWNRQRNKIIPDGNCQYIKMCQYQYTHQFFFSTRILIQYDSNRNILCQKQFCWAKIARTFIHKYTNKNFMKFRMPWKYFFFSYALEVRMTFVRNYGSREWMDMLK